MKKKEEKAITERAKAVAIVYPTYFVLKRHEKKLDEVIAKLGKLKTSEPVSKMWLYLQELKEFIELYEQLESANQTKILEKM
ncbi:MAG TPA: hypothetical protein PKX57_10850 [Mesotoga sp.]|jgi:hypothetical protein|nr:hypothetical protein [Mesotoga sp.]